MNRSSWIAAVFLWLALAAPAASQTAPAPDQTLVITTNPQGTSFYTAGAVLAKLLTEKAAVQARVRPTGGASSNVPALNKGDVDFALLNVVDTYSAYQATGDYMGLPPSTELRLVGVIFQVLFSIVVADDSPYRTIKDLKGVRMPTEYTSQKAVVPTIQMLLATGGTSLAEMKPFPVANYISGLRALGESKVDASGLTPGMAAAREVDVQLQRRGGLRLLPVDTSPEALATMRKFVPSARVVMLAPDPAMPEVRGPTPVTATSVFLVTHAGMPADLIYRVSKTIHENKAEIAGAHPVLRTFSPEAMTEASAAPYHAGAERFYTEIKQWPPKS